jgi:hypothetical protein
MTDCGHATCEDSLLFAALVPRLAHSMYGFSRGC